MMLIKRIIQILFFSLIGTCSLLMGQEPTKESLLQFDERSFDFGLIEEKNGIVSHDFHFKNVGETPVSINGVFSGCGCIKFKYPKNAVHPGESGIVTVSYNPAYRPGFFSKEVVVLSNKKAHYNRIWVKGRVNASAHPVSENYPYDYGNGLWMNLEVMAFVNLKKGESRTMKLKFANNTDREMKLMFVILDGNTDIRFTAPRSMKAHGEAVMPITYNYSGHFPIETYVYPVVNGKRLDKALRIKIFSQ